MVSAYVRSARQSWQMKARLTPKSCSIIIAGPLSASDVRVRAPHGQVRNDYSISSSEGVGFARGWDWDCDGIPGSFPVFSY